MTLRSLRSLPTVGAGQFAPIEHGFEDWMPGAEALGLQFDTAWDHP